MQASPPDFSSKTVAVIGLGKIGLPLAVQYAEHGWRVTGCDINPMVVDTINSGHAHLQEEPGLAAKVADLVQRGLLSATGSIAETVGSVDVVVVIVPVVIDAQHQVNFAGLDAATTAIGAGLQPGTLVIYETTLPVGTTAVRLRRILERASNLRAGRDFFLAYSPERVSSGSVFRDLRIYPKVVGGVDELSAEAATIFYQSVVDADIITMKSANDAEFVKLIETTYRDVNIALANEFARFADAHGLDVAEAIAAANTQPYSHIHSPGVGVGGHCIPVYPYFLLAGVEHAGEQGLMPDTLLLELPRSARRINDAMAEYAVHRIEAVTGPLVQQAVLILGVAYRGNVREAAFTSAQLLQEALLQHGASVYADDPLFSNPELLEFGYTPLRPEHEDAISAIILQASHTEYQALDFSRFSHCQVLLDGRHMFDHQKIESMGIHYIGIGDGFHEKPGRGREAQSVMPSTFQTGGHNQCELHR